MTPTVWHAAGGDGLMMRSAGRLRIHGYTVRLSGISIKIRKRMAGVECPAGRFPAVRRTQIAVPWEKLLSMRFILAVSGKKYYNGNHDKVISLQSRKEERGFDNENQDKICSQPYRKNASRQSALRAV